MPHGAGCPITARGPLPAETLHLQIPSLRESGRNLNNFDTLAQIGAHAGGSRGSEVGNLAWTQLPQGFS